MSEKEIIKNYQRSPPCNEVFANKEHQNRINDGFLTVKIVQCGNSRRMSSVSQTNPYDLCDTFQIKFPVESSSKGRGCCNKCRGCAKQTKNCPC